LGLTSDSAHIEGRERLTVEEAIARAWDWFATLPTELYADAKHAGRVDDLCYYPIGNVFTIGHVIKEYFDWKRLSWTLSSYRCALSLANTYILPRLGLVTASEITSLHIQNFVEYILETPPEKLAQRRGVRNQLKDLDEEAVRRRKDRVNEAMGILRSALVFAWENEKVDQQRCWNSLKPLRNVQGTRLLHLTRPECKTLLKHCRPELADMVQGALYTGCRIAELARMKVGDVARDGYGVYVAPSKTYRARFVFLPDEGMAFFLALIKGRPKGASLFRAYRETQWTSYQRKLFKKAVRAAGLPANFTFHGLRHTYASQLVQAGAPLIVVAQQLGHANINSVSAVYGHLAPQIREAEVRQRFTSISKKNLAQAQKKRAVLTKLHHSVQKADWRAYAQITDLGSRRKTK